MKDKTSFARYYNKGILFDYDMEKMHCLLKSKENKKEIANAIYHRFYDRHLKLFFYSSKKEKKHSDNYNSKIQNQFNKEFKSGFIIMSSCCIVIESISTFLTGEDRVKENKSGGEVFEYVFEKAKSYNNDLMQFSKKPIYKHIRCGLHHQGETYGKFKLTRSSKAELFNETDKKINATKFVKLLKDFLISYKNELETEAWDSEIWLNCRNKVECIIKNSKG